MAVRGPLFKLSPARRRLRRVARRSAWVVGVALLIAAGMVADRAGLFGRRALPDLPKYDGRSFRVAGVIDGDTFDVDCPDAVARDAGHPGAVTRIRLLGVDTPETIRPDAPVDHYGPQAAEYVRGLLDGRTVTLHLDPLRTRDRYDRLLAYVALPDGTDLNRRIVATGHGYADPRFRNPRQREFRRAQREAMKARRGLWAEITDADLPYYYRGQLSLPAPAAPTTRRSR